MLALSRGPKCHLVEDFTGCAGLLVGYDFVRGLRNKWTFPRGRVGFWLEVTQQGSYALKPPCRTPKMGA